MTTDAWGGAWSAAWANAWGTTGPVPPRPNKGTFGGRVARRLPGAQRKARRAERDKREQLSREDELALLAVLPWLDDG